MLTVKEFKGLGVVFVGDDKVQWRFGTALGVISFAWRPLNTLPDNPKFEYEVDIDAHSWRPLLDQSKNIRVGVMSNGDEVELVAANDDKPVFTQAMGDTEYELSLHKANSELLASLTDFMVKNNIGKIGESCIDVAIRELSEKFNIDTRTPKQKAVEEAMADIDADVDDVASVEGVVGRMIAAGYHKC